MEEFVPWRRFTSETGSVGGAALIGLCASFCVGAAGGEAPPVAAPTAARLEDFRNERRLVEFKDSFIIRPFGTRS